jgi:DtxR family Mn-dependent transcriptional regulator
VVVGVEDGSKEFFTFLKRYQIELGTVLKVEEKFSFDDSILVSINGKEVNLSSIIASKIYVQKNV